MRLAIFSDIHANLEALSVVLEAYEKENIDKYVCLGDVVGYGASPNECCDLVRPLVDQIVVGNHDAAVSGRMDYNYYYEACRFVLDLHNSTLSDENARWLKTIPYVRKYEVSGMSIGLSHGSPVNPAGFDYVFSFEHAFRLIPRFDELSDINFIGH